MTKCTNHSNIDDCIDVHQVAHMERAKYDTSQFWPHKSKILTGVSKCSRLFCRRNAYFTFKKHISNSIIREM